MQFRRKLSSIFLALFLLIPTLASAFIVHHIQVRGLQRIETGTVLNYMPFHVGQNYRPKDGPIIINALYDTNFFKSVNLYRRGSTLVVKVVERPIIGLLTITGNKKIKTKKLKPILKKLGIVEGKVFIPSNLNEIRVGLKQQYDMLGYYAATVSTQVQREPRNRVALRINIHEGPVAKVRRITFSGNHAFSDGKLRDQMQLTTPGLLTWYNHRDRYSSVQLTRDLASIQQFYYDHGYLRFHVVSQKVTITPDHKGVFIHITVFEGQVYHISGYRVAGPYAHDLHIQQIVSVLTPGQVFSRHTILTIDQNIANYFANQGYAFPNVKVVPQIDESKRTVYIIFQITSGRRVYVRRVIFVGNHRTTGRILRIETQQMEGSVFSLKHVNESKRRLANLPYLKNITVTPVPVAGKPNQVDLVYNVTEVRAGRASVQGGYSSTEKFIYGASLTEPDFMGSGKYVGLSFMRSGYSSNYQFSYENPFYTPYGISRGFTFYYNHARPNPKFNLEPYTMDSYGGKMVYGIPISTYSAFSIGAGIDHIAIANLRATAAPSILRFLQFNRTPFNQFNLILGVSRSTLDRAVFPRHGSVFSLSVTTGVPVIRRAVGYFKATLDGRWYYSFGDSGFIFNPHATLGYGEGYGHSSIYPFYNNFFAGGIETLPGFAPNSLGPKNTNIGNSVAIGGNVEILGGVNLIIPNPFSHKIRLALFLDAGNIFATPGNRFQYNAQQAAAAQTALGRPATPIFYESIALKNMRVSTGLLVSWLSPLGPIEFSLGYPIVFHGSRGDNREIFGFSFGGSL